MTSHRFASFSVMRTSSTPRGEIPRYVSPTYKSSVFNQTEGDEVAPVRSIRTYQSFHRLSEDFTRSSSGGWHTTKANHILPTVPEWIPKRSHVNDAEVYEKIEAEALVHAKNRSEQQLIESRERKEQKNREYNQALKVFEKKHAARLDHKKPKDEDKKAFKEAQNDHIDEIMELKRKQSIQNKNVLKTLDQQIEEKIKQKQLEIQRQQNDARTGLELKQRTQYDVEEHKNILKKQLEENQQKKNQIAQEKQKEQNERLQNLKDQENMWDDYRNKLASRQTQSSGGLRVKAQGSNELTEKGKVVHKVDLVQEHNRKSKQVRNDGEINSNWEAVSKALLKRKEMQDEYLREVKEQMHEVKRRKTAHTLTEKQEDKKHSGLRFTPYQPKESISQVTEILKKQLADKQQVKINDQKAKNEEKIQAINLHRTGEIAIRKKHEDLKRQKSELLTHYNNSLNQSASRKQHKGLTTVKI